MADKNDGLSPRTVKIIAAIAMECIGTALMFIMAPSLASLPPKMRWMLMCLGSVLFGAAGTFAAWRKIDKDSERKGGTGK